MRITLKLSNRQHNSCKAQTEQHGTHAVLSEPCNCIVQRHVYAQCVRILILMCVGTIGRNRRTGIADIKGHCISSV